MEYEHYYEFWAGTCSFVLDLTKHNAVIQLVLETGNSSKLFSLKPAPVTYSKKEHLTWTNR